MTFWKKAFTKPKRPRCFDRPLIELVEFESKQFVGREYYQVPLCIWLAVENLMIFGKSGFDEGIFRQSGDLKIFSDFKAQLDSYDINISQLEKDFQKAAKQNQHTMATLIKKYLLSLPEPLIGYDHYKSFIKAATLRDEQARIQEIKKLCNILPTPHLNTMNMVLWLLNAIHLDSENNKMTAENLGKAMGLCFLRILNSSSVHAISDLTFVHQCVATMIIHYDTIFGDMSFSPKTLHMAKTASLQSPKKQLPPPPPPKSNSTKAPIIQHEDHSLQRKPDLPPKQIIHTDVQNTDGDSTLKTPPSTPPKTSSATAIQNINTPTHEIEKPKTPPQLNFPGNGTRTLPKPPKREHRRGYSTMDQHLFNRPYKQLPTPPRRHQKQMSMMYIPQNLTLGSRGKQLPEIPTLQKSEERKTILPLPPRKAPKPPGT